MNRPSNKGLHYSTDIDGYAFNDYIENLEKYCDELEKKYNLAIKLISGLEAICPVSITKNCDDFEKCTECLDCFIQTEVERDKDE